MDEWEPEVEKIKSGIKIEEFLLLILKEVFYRGFGTYYFDDKCNEILELEKGGYFERRKATEMEIEFDRWRRIWYGKKCESICNETRSINRQVEDKMNIIEKNRYKDDEENPGVEVWEWSLIVS
jgi:hypothetical protein